MTAPLRLVLALLMSVIGVILTLPVLILGLPFWLMSLAVSLFARLTEPRVALGHELIQFDPVLGWRPKADLDTHYLVRRDDVYPVVTDSAGWPGRTTLRDSEIVVVGDSFAYGYGARKGESFADLDPQLKIKTVACPGYDIVQELLLLRHLRDQLAGKLVVWFIYPENDIPDIVRPHWRGYRKPFVRRSAATGAWEIVAEHLRPEKWRHSVYRDNLSAFSELCGPGPLSEHCYAGSEFLIGEAAAICRRAGAQLAILIIPNVNQLDRAGHQRLASLRSDPQAFEATYPEQRVGEICRKLGVPFIPGTRHLHAGDYKRFERFHWNLSGHRKVVRLLRELRERFALDYAASAVHPTPEDGNPRPVERPA